MQSLATVIFNVTQSFSPLRVHFVPALVPRCPKLALHPAAHSVAAVTVFGGFKPFLEPGLSSNLTEPDRAYHLVSRGLAPVPKPAQTVSSLFCR